VRDSVDPFVWLEGQVGCLANERLVVLIEGLVESFVVEEGLFSC